MQYEIERATVVTRRKDTRQSKLRSIAKQVLTITFNSTISNITYNCYVVLIKSTTLTAIKQITNIISTREILREANLRRTKQHDSMWNDAWTRAT